MSTTHLSPMAELRQAIEKARAQAATGGTNQDGTTAGAANPIVAGLAPVIVVAPTTGAAIAARRELALTEGAIIGVEFVSLYQLADQMAQGLWRTEPGPTKTAITPAQLEVLWAKVLANTSAGATQFADVKDDPSTIEALIRAYQELRELPPEQSETLWDLNHYTTDSVAELGVEVTRAMHQKHLYDVPDVYDAATEASALTVKENPLWNNTPLVPYLLDVAPLSPSQRRFVAALFPGLKFQAPKPERLPDKPVLVSATDADDETRWVVRQVKAQLLKSPAHRIAVLYSAKQPYARLLHQHFAAAEIPTYGPGPYSYAEYKVVRDILEFLGADELKRISEAKNWVDLIEAVLAALPDKPMFPGGISEFDSSAEIAALAELRKSIKNAAAFGELPGFIASPKRLKDYLAKELSRTGPSVGKSGIGVYVAPVSSAFGKYFDSVYLVGMSEDLYPGRIGIEPLIPNRIREVARAQGVELRTPATTVARKYQVLRQVVSNSGDVTITYPRSDLRSGGERSPSRWLPKRAAKSPDRPIPSHAAELRNTAIPASATEFEVQNSGNLATQPQDEWLKQENQTIVAALKMEQGRRSAELTRYDGYLTHKAGSVTDAKLAKIDPRRNGIPVSPSALEEFVDCPHSYFFKRVLKVEPIKLEDDTLAPGAAPIGTIIHRVYELMLEHCRTRNRLPGFGEPWPHNLVKLATGALLTQAVREQRANEPLSTGHATLWAIKEPEVKEAIADLIAGDNAWRAAHNAKPYAAEYYFGQLRDKHRTADPLTAVLVQLPPEQGPGVPYSGVVLMKGSADKVDISNDTIYITDIKTGKRYPEYDEILTSDDFAGGQKLQLPVYGLAGRSLKQIGNDPLPAPPTPQVKSRYWFVLKDDGEVLLPLDKDVLENYSEAIATITAMIGNGVFPATPPEDDDRDGKVRCSYCNPDGAGYRLGRARWKTKSGDAAVTPLPAFAQLVRKA